MKAKRSSRKREHSLNYKSENWSVLDNEKWSVSSPKKNLLGSNHLLQQTKQKKTEIKSKDAPRKMHST
jgi:hypothetical protein